MCVLRIAPVHPEFWNTGVDNCVTTVNYVSRYRGMKAIVEPLSSDSTRKSKFIDEILSIVY